MKYFLLLLALILTACSLNKNSTYWKDDSTKNTIENKKLSAILKKVNVNKSSKTLEKKNVIEMSVDEYNFYLESYLNKSDYPDINNKIVKPNNNIFYKFNLFLKNR